MYCNACGQLISDQARFCSHCGRVVGHPNATGRLVRPRYDRKVAGVCAAIAQHVDLDASLVRLLWVLITLTSGFFPGIITYILAWVIIPEEPALQPYYAPTPQPTTQQPVAG